MAPTMQAKKQMMVWDYRSCLNWKILLLELHRASRDLRENLSWVQAEIGKSQGGQACCKAIFFLKIARQFSRCSSSIGYKPPVSEGGNWHIIMLHFTCLKTTLMVQNQCSVWSVKFLFSVEKYFRGLRWLFSHTSLARDLYDNPRSKQSNFI